MRAGDEERKSDERLFSGVPPAPPSPTRFCRSFRHFRGPTSSSLPVLTPHGDLFFSSSLSLVVNRARLQFKWARVRLCVCVSSLRVRERVGE